MKTVLTLLTVFFLTAPALAQDKPAGEASAEPAEKPGVKAAEKEAEKKADQPATSEGAVTIGGQEIRYRTAAGTLPIQKPDGKPAAQVFYIAYTLATPPDAAERPVTFCFNGGPGSSSVWLHLGAFGPKRVELPGDGTTPPRPPGKLTPNEFSLLDVTDLVFIDPVGTGFSRAEDLQKAGDFYNPQEDIASVAEFIRLWVTREKRWRSPKFLAGESYGVFRAAGLANHLQDRHNLFVNGLLLVSGVVDFETLGASDLSDLSYPLFLPTFTAAAHYHQKLPADLQADRNKALAESRSFADGDYPRALRLGADLSAADRAKTIEQLARLTGLPAEKIDEQNLRISPDYFREMLLRKEGKIIGRYDARVVGDDGDATRPYTGFDPSFSYISGAFSAAFNSYVREDLKFEKDLPYEILARLNWNFGEDRGFPSTSAGLASALRENPHLRVLVQVGLRDLACPPEGMRYSIRHMTLPTEIRTHVRFAEYESGHMMYLNPPDLQKMHADATAFIKECVSGAASK